MKAKTGFKAGVSGQDAQRALGAAGAQVSSFINTAGAQAKGLTQRIDSTWRRLIGNPG